MRLKFKPNFVERYEKFTDFKSYEESIQKFPPRSIRVNILKISVEDLKERFEEEWLLEQIPWCKEGFYIKNKISGRRDIGNLKEHKEGLFFIQNSVTMIPAQLLNPSKNDLVLDMCAAPGAKTTHLAALMENKGRIIAIDNSKARIKVLVLNLRRCNVKNTEVIFTDSRSVKGSYDKILLDTPCSGTGRIKGKSRETRDILRAYNLKVIEKFSRIQKQLIEHAFNLLKKDGILIYSTCSLEPEEDEEIVKFLLDKYKNAELEKINLPIKGDFNYGLKIWPQYQNTEGFFVAKIKKIS